MTVYHEYNPRVLKFPSFSGSKFLEQAQNIISSGELFLETETGNGKSID